MAYLADLRNALAGVRTIAAGEAAGLKIMARGADPQFARGAYEMPIQLALSGHLARGAVFYDIGANVGFFSLVAARNVGIAGRVYSFEPVPANAERIRRAARLNNFASIKVFEMAVGATSGQTSLTLARHIGGATLGHVEAPPDPAGKIAVKITTLDDAVDVLRMRLPDLIKVDVEGAELDVFRGMVRTLAMAKPTVIFEVDDQSEQGLERKLSEIAAFLVAAGYRMARLPAAYPTGGWQVAHFVATPDTAVEPFA